jgi:ABC-type lipoprotein release transport system permease subunit
LLLGWRSFVRHRRRSIITTLAVSFSLAMMIVFVGLADDGHARMAEMGIRLGAGHVVVEPKGYQDDPTLDHLVEDPAAVIERADELDGVVAAAPRLQSSGLIQAGEISSAVVVSGVEPQVEPEISSIPKSRVTGAYLRRRADMEFENNPADIFLGDGLAEYLEVGVGDRVVLTVSPRHSSEPSSAAFFVRGTFHTGVSELDKSLAQIPLDEARKLFDTGSGVTQVAVLLDELDRTDSATRALAASLGSDQALEVISWKVALHELYEAIVLDDQSMYLMMTIIFVIVAIGIFNTVLMSVAERTREMGVMMAIGTSKRKLFSIVMAEATVLALVSAAVGLALGLWGHHYIATHGIDVGALAGGDYEFAGIAFSGKIYSRLSVGVVAKWTATVIGLVLASAVYPAVRATRLEPVEAMRHV